MKTEFRDIYEEYYLKVFRYIYKKTSHFQTAEDLTQDIFLSCLRNYDRYDPELASLNTWIFVITGNRLKNYYRSQKNCLSRYSKDDPAELVSEDYAEQAVLLEERRSMLLDIIDSLSEPERSVVALKYYRRNSSAEIAQALHLTQGNVRVILSRTLSKLRAHLIRQNYTSAI